VRILHAMECTIGGTRRHLVDVARGQLELGHKLALAVSCEREPRFRADLELLAKAGAVVFEIPMRREISPRRDLRHLRELRARLKEFAPDIVHTHSSKAGVLGRVASLQEECGVRVHTPHTFAFLFSAEFGRIKRAMFRGIEVALSRRTSRIIAVSEGEAETFKSSGVLDPAQVRTVRNGIDPSPWVRAKPASRRSMNIPDDAPLILVAGMLHIAKGQDLALEALRRPGLERAHILLLGDGVLRPALEESARDPSLAGRVHMPGWSEDVPGWMAACDIVLLPSRWEAMPYAVLEAMAGARPVVAARVDGAREMLVDGEHGALCDVADVDSIADGLRRTLAAGSARRQAMGLAGRQRLLSMATSERMVKGLLEVYTQAR
jgi:glycosyltransferase involved in cell wall biosynthesis